MNFQLMKLLALFLTIATAATTSHPNHVTLTEIEYNRDSGKFEVSLCVWPEDLEFAISKLHQAKFPKKSFRLNDDTVAQFFPQYLNSRFNLQLEDSNKKSRLPIRWVGCELSIKKAWLFFEVAAGVQEVTANNPAIGNWNLENKLFFEHNDDQVNHVKFKRGKAVSWHQSTKLNPQISLRAAKK